MVRADIQNGLMTFPKGIAIDSDRIDFVSGGTISLPKDKVNLTLNIFYEGLTSVSITQALSNLVKITGTITSPRISINQEGTLKTIAGVALSGGTYAGAEMLLNRDSAPCYTALNDTIYKDKFEKPTGVRNAAQKTYQGTSQAVDNSINMVKTSAKEIKNAAKNLIRGTKKQKAE